MIWNNYKIIVKKWWLDLNYRNDIRQVVWLTFRYFRTALSGIFLVTIAVVSAVLIAMGSFLAGILLFFAWVFLICIILAWNS